MKVLMTSVSATPPITRAREHEGSGTIVFRRLLASPVFEAPIDFVDYTIIPPGSVIGRHCHNGNEEMYFVISGSPLVRVDDCEARLVKGSLSVVRNGQSHELVNDTASDVEILVVQVRI